VSQAGLALALAGVARRASPEWGVSLEALVLAMIGVHLVMGPILFRWGLARMGDGREEVGSAEADEALAVGIVPGSHGRV
jgi:hypothetical protein